MNNNLLGVDGGASDSGGNIGAITPTESFHVNGHINFHSAQLGRRARQALLWQVRIKKELDPFGQALLELANSDKEQFLEAFHAEPKRLASELAPHLSKLSEQKYPQALEIVTDWLERVNRDVEVFQEKHQLESLPICLGGSTFTDLKKVIPDQLKFPSGCFISSIPLEEGALNVARKQAIAHGIKGV